MAKTETKDCVVVHPKYYRPKKGGGVGLIERGTVLKNMPADEADKLIKRGFLADQGEVKEVEAKAPTDETAATPPKAPKPPK